MGIVLGVEAAVAIAEAAEAGAGAAEAIASTAEAAETISAGVDAGAEAGSAAADEAAAAVGSGGEALASAVETLTNALSKLGKMVGEFIVIDSVFKLAKEILGALLSDPSALARAKRLDKLIKVLNQSSSLMKTLIDWLQVHADDTTDINDITVTTQGVLSKFIPHLGAAEAVLQTLSKQISKKNLKKQPVTESEIDAIQRSLQTVLDSFKSLAEFKAQHQARVPKLSGLPIDEQKVSSLQAEMP